MSWATNLVASSHPWILQWDVLWDIKRSAIDEILMALIQVQSLKAIDVYFKTI